MVTYVGVEPPPPGDRVTSEAETPAVPTPASTSAAVGAEAPSVVGGGALEVTVMLTCVAAPGPMESLGT